MAKVMYTLRFIIAGRQSRSESINLVVTVKQFKVGHNTGNSS